MARFLLFGGENYYPQGGWDDLMGEYGSLEVAQMEAMDSFDEDALDGVTGRWFQVVVADPPMRVVIRGFWDRQRGWRWK